MHAHACAYVHSHKHVYACDEFVCTMAKCRYEQIRKIWNACVCEYMCVCACACVCAQATQPLECGTVGIIERKKERERTKNRTETKKKKKQKKRNKSKEKEKEKPRRREK